MLSITEKDLELTKEKFDGLPYRCGTWLPTMQEVKEHIEPNFKTFLPVIMWILVTGCEDDSPKSKEVRDYLRELTKKNIKIINQTTGETP